MNNSRILRRDVRSFGVSVPFDRERREGDLFRWLETSRSGWEVEER